MLKKVNKFIKGKEMLCCVICFFLGFIVCKMMNNIEGMNTSATCTAPSPTQTIVSKNNQNVSCGEICELEFMTGEVEDRRACNCDCESVFFG